MFNNRKTADPVRAGHERNFSLRERHYVDEMIAIALEQRWRGLVSHWIPRGEQCFVE